MQDRASIAKPRDHTASVDEVAGQCTINLTAGELFHIAFPCLYLVIEDPQIIIAHDRMRHDHDGWPSPGHPDHVCQGLNDTTNAAQPYSKIIGPKKRLDLQKIKPIHLAAEGYNEVLCDMIGNPETLLMVGEIDGLRDWVVNVTVDATQIPLDSEYHLPFSVRVASNFDTDPVCTGQLNVLPIGGRHARRSNH